MTPLAWTIVQFALCALLILAAGVRLARYGERDCREDGPWRDVDGRAGAGDAIGSCMFNLVILAFLDVRDPRPLSARVHQGHVLTAGFGIVLLGVASLAIAAGGRAPVGQLAAQTGLGESFVGSILVATATSLPEVVVSVAAARLGAMDMAVGNLFGSNLLNIAVLGMDDVLYTRGSLLLAVEPAHLATSIAAMVMTAMPSSV